MASPGKNMKLVQGNNVVAMSYASNFDFVATSKFAYNVLKVSVRMYVNTPKHMPVY